MADQRTAQRPSPGEELSSSQLTSHWDWRPEWTSERPNLWWYATFESDPTVRRLARDVQETIRPGAPVDPIPLRWLHLSLAEVGYVADVPAAVAHECVSAAREALAATEGVPLSVGPATAMPGAVVLDVRAPVLGELQDNLVTALASTVRHPPAQRPFAPHISVAYVRTACTREDVLDGTSMRQGEPPTEQTATTRLADIALVEVVRDQRHYRWVPRHRVSLGSR